MEFPSRGDSCTLADIGALRAGRKRSTVLRDDGQTCARKKLSTEVHHCPLGIKPVKTSPSCKGQCI